MNDKYIQYIRLQLKENFQLLQSVSWGAFQSELRLFLDFLRSTSIIKSILDELTDEKISLGEWLAQANKQRTFILPANYDYKKRATLCLKILEKIENDSDPYAVTKTFALLSPSTRVVEHVTLFISNVLTPFYSYLDTRINAANIPLYLMRRFKHRAEWFHSDELLSLYQANTKHGEESLDRSLREFLFDQGIDYPFSTPLSPSGRTDILGNLNGDDYFIIEVKVFDAESYEKGYIRKGFVQAIRYIEDYKKEVGFLVVFNVSNKKIEFDFGGDRDFVRANNKTIFFIVINLNNTIFVASEQRKLDSYIISEDYLKENLRAK